MITIEDLEHIAKKIIERDGHHNPQLILDDKGRLEIHVLLFRDDKQKDIMLKQYRNLVQARNIQSYFVIMESWVSKKAFSGKLPRDDPDRTEALVIQQFKKNRDNNMLVNMFSRKGKKVIWGERHLEKTNTFSASIWDFFVEEDSYEEKIGSLRWQHFMRECPDAVEKLDKFVDKIKGAPEFKGKSKEEIKKDMLDKMKKMVKEGRVVKKDGN